MKTEIPEGLKKELPQTPWGKTLMATPVVMTVVATMLAGLASSEMTRAQYDRALAAQQQSKAGDQWSFFQAKRLRGALQRNTLELMQLGMDLPSFRPPEVLHLLTRLGERLSEWDTQAREALGRSTLPPVARQGVERYLAEAERRQAEALQLKEDAERTMASEGGRGALARLQVGELPPLAAGPETPQPVRMAMEAVEASAPDAEVRALLLQFDAGTVEAALSAARNQVKALEETTGPVNDGIETWEKLLGRRAALLGEWPAGTARSDEARVVVERAVERSFSLARLRYNAMRYDAEARLNQAIANLYELQVRRSNMSAERHHARSQRFFFGMLAAQMAVIIATFAIAARQRNLLWSLAAAAGIAAILLSIYVYVFV